MNTTLKVAVTTIVCGDSTPTHTHGDCGVSKVTTSCADISHHAPPFVSYSREENISCYTVRKDYLALLLRKASLWRWLRTIPFEVLYLPLPIFLMLLISYLLLFLTHQGDKSNLG